jgi:hypothetical protein
MVEFAGGRGKWGIVWFVDHVFSVANLEIADKNLSSAGGEHAEILGVLASSSTAWGVAHVLSTPRSINQSIATKEEHRLYVPHRESKVSVCVVFVTLMEHAI